MKAERLLLDLIVAVVVLPSLVVIAQSSFGNSAMFYSSRDSCFRCPRGGATVGATFEAALVAASRPAWRRELTWL